MIGSPCQPGRLRPPHPIVPPESARPATRLQRRLIALAGMLWLALCLATAGALLTAPGADAGPGQPLMQATSSAPAADAPATPDTGDAVVQPAESSGEGDDLADPRRAQAGLRRAQTCIGTTTDSTRADDRRWRRRGQAPPLA